MIPRKIVEWAFRRLPLVLIPVVVGFAGSAQIALSDILSNHVIQIGASVYGSLSDSDLFLGYYNLSRRTNWGVSAFQFRNDFGIYAAPDRMTESAKKVFLNAIVYMKRFDGHRGPPK